LFICNLRPEHPALSCW